MTEIFQRLFLVIAIGSFILSGCAAGNSVNIPGLANEVSPTPALEDRAYFPEYNLSINMPPRDWERQHDLGQGELAIWLNREAGSVIEIMVSNAARNLSYPAIASEFRRITCALIGQRSPGVTCIILEEKEVIFQSNKFYLVRIAYQGLAGENTVRSRLYLYRTGDLVYHFLFMEEQLNHLANEMMQSVVFHDIRGLDEGEGQDQGDLPLIDACYHGDMARVEQLLVAGVDVNARNKDGVTALAYASNRGEADIVAKLLSRNADVNARSSIGGTALMNAAYTGKARIAEMLLAAGADVNARSRNGTSALMNAAAHGFLDVVLVLLHDNAEVNARDVCGLNALWNAVSGGYCDIAEVLIGSGADVNARANDGTTLLMNAVFTGNSAMVKMLLDAGARVNAKADNGWTALTLAKKMGFSDIVRLLIEAGAMEDSPLEPRLYFNG